MLSDSALLVTPSVNAQARVVVPRRIGLAAAHGAMDLGAVRDRPMVGNTRAAEGHGAVTAIRLCARLREAAGLDAGACYDVQSDLRDSAQAV
jgi:hypothetical protein